MSQEEVVGFIFETTGPKSDETFKFCSIKNEDCIKIGRNILFQLGQVDADTVSYEAEGFNAQIRFFALIHFCCVLVTLSDLGSSRGFCLLQKKKKERKKRKNPPQQCLLSASSCRELFAWGASSTPVRHVQNFSVNQYKKKAKLNWMGFTIKYSDCVLCFQSFTPSKQ